jgi:hypothetical protein
LIHAKLQKELNRKGVETFLDRFEAEILKLDLKVVAVTHYLEGTILLARVKSSSDNRQARGRRLLAED